MKNFAHQRRTENDKYLTLKMTNVKLKLMFFLLNALLAIDLVHCRPYSDNSTDYFSLANNTQDEISIPVESNSDTLIVAPEPQTSEQMNKNAKKELEDIVNAEQGRDESILSEHAKDKNTNPQTKDHEESFDKQSNISSALDDIIDAEILREESMTDSLSERTDGEPKYQFLVSLKSNETIVKNNISEVDVARGNNSDPRKTEYVELVAVGKNIKISENRSAYTVNLTSHEVDNDLEPDTILSMFSGFTDLQTLFLTCFATLLPLLGALFATLCIRCLIRKWCPQCCCCCRKKPVESSDSESSDSKHSSPRQQLKSIPEQTSEGGGEEDDEDEGGGQPANGSIITMTLKNNHLIVETEERNDFMKNGRETKLKYSPDNEGIFVVEVQQSATYRPNKPQQNSPPLDPQISTNQALIHRPPEDVEIKTPNTEYDEISEKSSDFDKAKALALSSTGLSISDLSMSSIGSHNASYSYGNQTGYEQGPFGYPVYAGYDVPKEDIGNCIIHDNSREPLIAKTPTDIDKPVVTAAIFKQDSIIGNDVLQGPGYCIEGSTDGPLLSDVQAREMSLQQLHDKMEQKVENGITEVKIEKVETPKRVLTRADSLPVRMEDEKLPDPVKLKNDLMDTIQEDEIPINTAMLKGKRASLPIIRTEMYDSVRQVFLPAGSPKFEKFTDDVTPEDDPNGQLPMVTITEEPEAPSKVENGS